jgi:glycosyltransferase involved in cell wall biosynthesis
MQSKPRIIVSVTNDLYTDQRVHKVCMYLHEHNWDVLLVGRRRKMSKELDNRPYATHRMRLMFEKGVLFYAAFNFRLFLFLLVRKADVVLSNDLDTLLANYLAKKIKRNCSIVYDSHELFTEVPELTSRPTVRSVWLAIERWIFPKLEFVFTVNSSIAEIYEQRYGKPIHVLRNVSPRWTTTAVKNRAQLGLPEKKKLIILQGAGINIDRGAEEAVEAMRLIPEALNSCLIVVGDGDVIPHLKTQVAQDSVLVHRVLFYDKKPYRELMQYTAHAHIGLSLDKDNNPNYQFSLPNKLFDYMHAGTPMVVSEIKEVKRVVEQYQIGIVIDEHSPTGIAGAIIRLLSDEEVWKAYQQRCFQAANIENWEQETMQLQRVYQPLWNQITGI